MTAPHSPRWWQWPTVLSLDAPLVVVVWQWLIGAIVGAAPQWPETGVVGASVWLAYSADRWFEAVRVPAEQLVTPRHRFYRRYRRPVAALWLAVLVLDVAIAFAQLSARELTAGAALLAAVVLYVVSHQQLHRTRSWRLPKEGIAAGLLATGAGLFTAVNVGATRAVVASMVLFAVLCFTNLALIGVWESEVDESQGQESLPRRYPGAKALFRFLPIAVGASAAVVGGPTLGIPAVPAHCVAASGVLLALVDRYEHHLGWQRARILADLVLLTPLVPLLRSAA